MTERLTFLRAFPSQFERSGPRQLTGRLVPYGLIADVADPLPNGELDVYQEGFRPGAFTAQSNSRERGVISKIGLVHRHEGGLGFLGPFVALREQEDGLYGDVAVLRSKQDDVEDLLSAGVDELSVEFRLHRSNHTEVDSAGVRWRTRAHLDQVALEPKGAYSSARVLAYRAELDEVAAAEAADRQKREAEETERAARQHHWEELSRRLDRDLARQEELVRDYGVTRLPRRP